MTEGRTPPASAFGAMSWHVAVADSRPRTNYSICSTKEILAILGVWQLLSLSCPRTGDRNMTLNNACSSKVCQWYCLGFGRFLWTWKLLLFLRANLPQGQGGSGPICAGALCEFSRSARSASLFHHLRPEWRSPTRRVYALTTRTSQARFMVRSRRETGNEIPHGKRSNTEGLGFRACRFYATILRIDSDTSRRADLAVPTQKARAYTRRVESGLSW